ncbi:MAG TPA: hypothetical protein VIQ31_26265, partial [Phormidium sp.]
MDFVNNYEQLLRQLTELQRGAFNNFSSMMPNMQSFTTPNFRDTYGDILKFQEQAVANSLELQALVARLSIEAQKQFWDN